MLLQGFARSVVAVDIDGDMLAEVLVGAPDYFEHLTHSGAVYIFTHTPDGGDFNDEAVNTIKVRKIWGTIFLNSKVIFSTTI